MIRIFKNVKIFLLNMIEKQLKNTLLKKSNILHYKLIENILYNSYDNLHYFSRENYKANTLVRIPYGLRSNSNKPIHCTLKFNFNNLPYLERSKSLLELDRMNNLEKKRFDLPDKDDNNDYNILFLRTKGKNLTKETSSLFNNLKKDITQIIYKDSIKYHNPSCKLSDSANLSIKDFTKKNEFNSNDDFYSTIVTKSLLKSRHDISCTKSKNNHFSFNNYQKNKTIILSKQENKENLGNNESIESIEFSSSFLCFFNSDSLFKKILDFISFILVLYSIFITPIHLTYIMASFEFKIIECFVEVYLFFEIILNFFISYYDHEDNLISDYKLLAKNYLKTWFIIDFLSSLPFELISYSLGFYYTNDFYLNGIEWIKVVRFFKLFNERSTGRFLNYFDIYKNNSFNRIFKFSLFFLLITHISSCFFVYLATCSLNTNNWIYNLNINFQSKFDIYIASMYYVVVTTLSIGYGDIVPVSIIERIWGSIYMVCGSILYSYAISSLSNIFKEENKKYTVYNNKVSILRSIMLEYSICNTLYNKIKKSIKEEYKKDNSDIYEFLDMLPSNIKKEIMVIMYEGNINLNHFFKNQKHDLILTVLQSLKNENFLKGDILFYLDDVVEQMYFVMKGLLTVGLGSQYHNIEIESIRCNDYYGDLLMYLNKQSPYEVKCKRSVTEVMILKKTDFIKIMNSHHYEVLKILELSSEKMLNYQMRKEVCKDLLNNEISYRNVQREMKKIDLNIFDKHFMNWYHNENEELYDTEDLKEDNNKPKSIRSRKKIKSKNQKYVDSQRDIRFINKGISMLKKKYNSLIEEITENNKKILPKHEESNLNPISFSARLGSSINNNDLVNKKKFRTFYRQITRKIGERERNEIVNRENDLNKRAQLMFDKYNYTFLKKDIKRLGKITIKGSKSKTTNFLGINKLSKLIKNKNKDTSEPTYSDLERTNMNDFESVKAVNINILQNKNCMIQVRNCESDNSKVKPVMTNRFSIRAKIRENKYNYVLRKKKGMRLDFNRSFKYKNKHYQNMSRFVKKSLNNQVNTLFIRDKMNLLKLDRILFNLEQLPFKY